MLLVFQQPGGGSAGTWTSAQIHDTVAKIVAQPMFAPNARQSLVGRFFRFLLERLSALIAFFAGSANARVALILFGLTVVATIGARIVVARRLREDRRRLGLAGGRAALAGRPDYWTLARDEAANGRYAEACHAIYAAVVETFARAGLVSLHASKTSGDYARELRRGARLAGAGADDAANAPVAADFRSFARQFDRVIFGTPSVRSDDYVRLRESAERVARTRTPA